ncbi:MAG: AEC family transporter [Clostridiales bacterium]|nr:AEC family transporter [Clostridiales bacterium]
MSSELIVLIEQIKIIATLMVIGIVWRKSGLINDNLVDSLSAIMARLILPFMICTTIGSVSRSELSNGVNILIGAAIMYCLSTFLSVLSVRFLKLKEPNRSMHAMLQCYCNTGFIGIPLITSMFPETAGLAAAAFMIIESPIYWVLGPCIAGKVKPNFRKLISPLTVSVVLGLIIVLLNVDLSGNIVWQTAQNVGGTCKYFASIYIGMTIARMDFSKLKANLFSIAAVPAKLIVMPLLTFFIVGKTGLLSGDYLTMLVILCATPAGMTLPVISELAKVDSADYASVGVTISTVFCLVSLPLVVWLIGIL